MINPSRPSPPFRTASDKSWVWRPGNEARACECKVQRSIQLPVYWSPGAPGETPLCLEVLLVMYMLHQIHKYLNCITDILQHCIGPQSSVPSLYGRLWALTLPCKEYTEFWEFCKGSVTCIPYTLLPSAVLCSVHGHVHHGILRTLISWSVCKRVSIVFPSQPSDPELLVSPLCECRWWPPASYSS